jgi:hypothetical protein
MINRTSSIIFCIVLGMMGPVYGQDAATLTSGKAFAESIAPKSKNQVVDPAAVNATAWSFGSTAMPTATQAGLGAFSAPLTTSTLFSTSKASGALAGLGNDRIAKCRVYVPTGDPIADQECAAVLFMDKDCVPLSTTQAGVTGAVGLPTSASTACAGSYGSGVSKFGYYDTLNATDPIFHLSHESQANASNAVTQTCVSKPVITKPAEFETNNCAKTVVTNEQVCTQELGVVISTSITPATPSYSCTGGTLDGQYCVRTDTSPAAVSYFCPAGTLSGVLCLSTTSVTANLSYTCPPGATLDGATCNGTSVIPANLNYSCSSGTLSGDQCLSSYAATVEEYCWPGSALTGHSCTWNAQGPVADATCTYYGTIVGWICSKDASRNYSCPSGGTVNGTTCTTSVAATINYTCSSGTLSGANCIISESGPATPVYSCTSGTLSGDQCISTVTDPATPTYHCPDGAILNGQQCDTTTTVPADLHYSCPGGIPPTGGQCISVLQQTNWIDNCKPYEDSAGITLGAPK